MAGKEMRELTNTQILIKNIKEIIQQKGIAEWEVAELAEISRVDFDKLLAGGKVITAEYIPRIASALGISIDVLYGAAAPSVLIGDVKYSEIDVTDRDNNLIASITAENIIEHKGYKVVCIPAVN